MSQGKKKGKIRILKNLVEEIRITREHSQLLTDWDELLHYQIISFRQTYPRFLKHILTPLIWCYFLIFNHYCIKIKLGKKTGEKVHENLFLFPYILDIYNIVWEVRESSVLMVSSNRKWSLQSAFNSLYLPHFLTPPPPPHLLCISYCLHAYKRK